MKQRRYLLNIQDVPEIDFRDIIESIGKKLKVKSGGLVSLLRTLSFDDRKFRFVYDPQGNWHIWVLCPLCGEKKVKLFKLDSDWGCSDCHHLARPARRKKPGVTTVYSRYIRPMRMLNEIEARLLDPNGKLTERQRRVLEAKAAKLRQAMPEYAEILRQQVLNNIGKS